MPVTTGMEAVSGWRSLVQVFASGRPRLYPFSFILIMFLMIVVAGEVSKAVGVGFDSAASVQVDPRNVSLSPIRGSSTQVVIIDNMRLLRGLQLLNPFQLGSGASRFLDEARWESFGSYCLGTIGGTPRA